ncbi:hypothetical protein BaRGS_00004513 [Batillaria attramentaria]|uniref:Uncharacterized protein n=1 Tax=Batillaria attramentaria TaxID=370345 RepID=A0ABD0LX98_9CAEN
MALGTPSTVSCLDGCRRANNVKPSPVTIATEWVWDIRDRGGAACARMPGGDLDLKKLRMRYNERERESPCYVHSEGRARETCGMINGREVILIIVSSLLHRLPPAAQDFKRLPTFQLQHSKNNHFLGIVQAEYKQGIGELAKYQPFSDFLLESFWGHMSPGTRLP